MRARLAVLALALPLLLQGKATGLLKDYDDYFEGARLDNGVVSAKATKAFSELPPSQREAEIKSAMRELDESLQNLEGPVLLRIDDGAGGSLWALPEGGKAPLKLESWDATKDAAPAGSLAGRWFTYVGVGAVLSLPSSGTSVNFGINYGVKLGTFLYRDFLDLGVNLGGNLNLGVSDYSTDTGTVYDLGAFSRVHVPIFGMLGASLGLEGSYSLSNSSSDPYSGKSSSSSSSSSQGALLAGLSLFLPSGSIDFDARFSTTASYNIGLTTFLGPSHSVTAAPEKARAQAQPKKKATRSPTPEPEPSPEEEAAQPSPTATPRAADTPSPTSTSAPTTEPTPVPTSTPLPTAAPTAAPTVAATPDARIEEEAKKLEAEKKSLADEKAKLAEERRQLEEDKKAAKAAAPESGQRMKRSGFHLYGGVWRTKMGSDYLDTYGPQLNYGLRVFLGDFRIGFGALTFHGEYAPPNTGGPLPMGNRPNPQFDAMAWGGTLGYDWTFLRAASAQGFEMYLPLEFGVRQVDVQAGTSFGGGNVEAAIGLGMRWRIAEAFALDASARFHAPFLADTLSDGSSFMKSGSTEVTSNLQGPEFSLATDFYLW